MQATSLYKSHIEKNTNEITKIFITVYVYTVILSNYCRHKYQKVPYFFKLIKRYIFLIKNDCDEIHYNGNQF